MAGRFGWRYFIIGASRGIEYRLRDDMFSIWRHSRRYYNSHKTGDLMAYFTNDLQAVRMGTGMAVITVFDAVIMTVMVLVKNGSIRGFLSRHYLLLFHLFSLQSAVIFIE